VSGLAAQFGLSSFSQEGSQSPQFFADLVTSPTVLRDVASARYTIEANGHKVTQSLIQAYGKRTGSPSEQMEAAAKELAEHLSTSVSVKTGLVTLKVTNSNPDLAAQIASTLIDRINAVNLRLRQEQAAADRQFAELQVAGLAGELRAAEDRLQQFMQENRDIRTPRLTLEQDRLSRDVSMKQSVYSAMQSSYEQDRIESLRDNPVIAVVDYPTRPPTADSRGVIKGLIGGVLVGFLIGIIASLILDLSRSYALTSRTRLARVPDEPRRALM
jgi:uncharacterized protein involved in exopolysaccharide biosynthesis